MGHFPRFCSAIVLIHLLVATLHGVAHRHLGIGLSVNQQLFVVFVITLAPLLAMVFTWTRLRTTGAALLLIAMAGSLIFGVANHYLIVSPDHVSHLAGGNWALVFQITALFLVITELLGCLMGLKELRG
jgi:hypothetical protein